MVSGQPEDRTHDAPRGWRAHPAPFAAALIVLVLGLGIALSEPIASAIRFVFGKATAPHVMALAGLVALVGLAGVARRRRRTTMQEVQLPEQDVRNREYLDRVPWPLSVGLVAAIAAVGWYSLGRAAAVPRIFADELIYASAARSLAEDGDLGGNGYGLVTPLLDAGAYLLTSNDVDAYRLIQALNIAIMVSASFPAYLLARRAVSAQASLMVAALTVIVPWMVYARFVMTEAAFYPVFLLFVLALVRALEHPTLQRQLVLVLALALAFLTRTQAVALVGAVGFAVGLYGCVRQDLRGTLRSFVPTMAVYAAVGAAIAALAAVGGVRPLGAYSVLTEDIWHPRGFLIWVAANVTSLTIGLGILAVVAAPLGAAALLRRRAAPPEQAFAAAAVSSTLFLLLTVAVLSVSPYGQGIPHERNLFFSAPLIFVCALAWAERGFPRPRLLTAITAVGMIALAAQMPSGVITINSIDALSFKLWALFPHGGLSTKTLIVVAVAAGTVVVIRLRTTWPLVASVALMALGIAAASDYTSDIPRSLTPLYGWVDRVLPADARAAILWIGVNESRCPAGTPASRLDKIAVYTEYFNSRIGPVGHVLADNAARGLASETFAVLPSGIVTGAGRPLRPRYVVTDARVEVAGSRLAVLRARDVGVTEAREGSALALWRVDQPLRLVEPAKAVSPAATCAPFPA